MAFAKYLHLCGVLSKGDIRKLTLDELEGVLVGMGEDAYRAKQIWAWLWGRGVVDFEQMSNLSKVLRGKLGEHFFISPVREDLRQVSLDGTVKFRLRLGDGLFVESVLIPVVRDGRYTVCVSSQVGCSLSCAFCATGKMKRMRNLDASEIYDQVSLAGRATEQLYRRALTNVVYMGMGEPLLNYKQVLRSIDLICSEWGLNMAARRLTISTAGVAKMIERLAEDSPRVNLALSLHAPNDQKRGRIMAINEQNNIERLMRALKYFYKHSRGKISYEYIALDGFNDTEQDARELISLCRAFPVHVNIIEYNSVPGINFGKTKADRLERFVEQLSRAKINVTVRRSRGEDIDAACGQLAGRTKVSD